MKLLTLVSSLLAVASATELEAQALNAGPGDPPANLLNLPNGQKILPRLLSSPPRNGASRKHVSYGNYVISSKAMTKATKRANGPCTGACLVTAMEATIKYGRGISNASFAAAKEANVDTGAWLHHIALFGGGGGSGSLWAAGNERPTLRLDTSYKYGLELSSFMLIIDLMSEDSKSKDVELFISYDYVPKGAAGFKAAYMYWLTIGEPAAKNGVYKFTTMPATAKVNGKLLYAIGHMHDGGTDMRLFVGSKMVCKSVMHYNAREGYNAKDGGMAGMSHGGHARRDGHGGGGSSHISDPGACTDFGDVKSGERMTAEAWYDANKHPLMIHNGKKEALMGNMRVYIGPA